MQKYLLGARASLYYLGFFLSTLIFATICLVFSPLLLSPLISFSTRFKVITLINFFYHFWLWLCCGIKVKVEGRENLPADGAFVVVANHQSEWETFFLQTLVRPQSVVLKKELLSIPFFGWALSLLKPIALDRSQRRGALKQLIKQGKERLALGIPVLIFPQGTRVPQGKVGKFNKGGAMLAVMSDVVVVPMVHDAAYCWPGKSFIKYSGTVTLRIGEPIVTTGLSVDEVHEQSKDWLLANMRELDALHGVIADTSEEAS